MNPQPTAGYLYNSDGSLSAPPAYPSPQYFQNIVAQAVAFGNSIIIQSAARNVSAGITQAGQTLAMMTYCSQLMMCLSTGSLYEAIAELNTMIADTSTDKTNLSPFLTNDLLYATMNSIQTYLEIPLTPNPGP
jgi:hypothetical protein